MAKHITASRIASRPGAACAVSAVAGLQLLAGNWYLLAGLAALAAVATAAAPRRSADGGRLTAG